MSRNWQGVDLLSQSPFLSLRNHFFLKSAGEILKCDDIRRMSLFVYVGDISLQQFAQLRQSTSRQTSASDLAASLSKPLGGFFLSLLRNLLNADLR
jgi:hypothetical protein